MVQKHYMFYSIFLFSLCFLYKQRLEDGRKAKSAEFYKVKKADAAAKAKAAESVPSEISAVLAANGF